MATQFTPCPACGAVGEVGSNCQFCGTTIILKEGATFSDARIIKQRTITPQQYAEKISIYHNIEGLCNGVSKVSIGEQEGIVNLNGDLIYPLGNERISKGFQDGIVRIGKKFLNLESFEYVEDPYLNETLLKKITIMSEEIKNNPSSNISIYAFDTALSIDNSSIVFGDRCTPQLMISHDIEQLTDNSIYKRFASCNCFESFTPDNIDEIPQNRNYYYLCGNDIEDCCRTMMQILQNVYEFNPEDALKHIEYDGEVFGNDSINNVPPSSNSGCAGMLALILGVGGAGIYGLVELISKLIA